MDTKTTPVARGQLDLSDACYPNPPVDDQVVADVLLRRWETRAAPVSLAAAIRGARDTQARGNLTGLDSALIDVAAAALNSLSTLRRHAPFLARRHR